MSKSIQIRTVPEALHRRLKAPRRTRRRLDVPLLSCVRSNGRSRGRAGREWLEAIGSQPEVVLNRSPADILRGGTKPALTVLGRTRHCREQDRKPDRNRERTVMEIGLRDAKTRPFGIGYRRPQGRAGRHHEIRESHAVELVACERRGGGLDFVKL